MSTTAFERRIADAQTAVALSTRDPEPAPSRGDVSIVEAKAQLAEIAALPDGWSSYDGRPSPVAVDLAATLIEDAARLGHSPTLVTPSVDGGVVIRFTAEGKTARLETTSDGEAVLVTQDSYEAAANYADIDPSRAASALDEFLS